MDEKQLKSTEFLDDFKNEPLYMLIHEDSLKIIF